ncbi:BnaA09g13410D [Brassica napus]|uniref:BnaA09g13410D protein n=2 Tax=Brassica TaxID=3705 RepID=A0A078FL70_BRANA|nr:BnaA09g13410D [Brassica napus]
MANPASQVSVIANLVAARGAAEMGWRECALCLFSLGMVHYLVIFVTLYQRLPGGNNFPTTLRPVFFLFFAAPATGSLAWNHISGTFDTVAKMLFFLSLFIFVSLVCRPTLLKKSIKRFNVAWWAYSFPITFLALDSVQYAEEVKHHVASALMFIFCSISVLIFLGVMLLTAANSKRLLRRDPVLWSATGPKTDKKSLSANANW